MGNNRNRKTSDEDGQLDLVVRSMAGTELATVWLAVKDVALADIVAKLPVLPQGAYELLSEDAELLDEDAKLRAALQEAHPLPCITAVVVDMPLQARVARLLWRLRPSNEEAIAEEIAKLEPRTADDLESIAAAVVEKAAENPEVCGPLATVAQALRSSCPAFPPEHGGSKRVVFLRVLLNFCQDTFEAFQKRASDSEQTETDASAHVAVAATSHRRRLQRILAAWQGHRAVLVHFIGHLYLRSLLPMRGLLCVLDDCLRWQSEYGVECACELLRTLGPQKVVNVRLRASADPLQRLEQLLVGAPALSAGCRALVSATLEGLRA